MLLCNTASVGATVQPYNVNTSLLGQSIDTSELDPTSFLTWDQNLWDDLTADNFATFAATLGYITDGNTNWDNSYGFITASSTDTLTNKSGNISMWTNDSNYVTLADTQTWNKNIWNSLTFDNLSTAAASLLDTWAQNKFDYVNTASVGATVQPYNVNTSLLGSAIDE